MPEYVKMPHTICIGDEIFQTPYRELFRDLTTEEFGALEESIAEDGILDRILITEENDVVAGANRLLVAEKLKLPMNEVPIMRLEGYSSERILRIVMQSNIARRQIEYTEWNVTRKSKIAKLLKENPKSSNRSIAEKTGSNRGTVKAERERLEAAGEIEKVTETVGTNGSVNHLGSKPKPIPDALALNPGEPGYEPLQTILGPVPETPPSAPIQPDEDVRRKPSVPKPETKPEEFLTPSGDVVPDHLRDVFSTGQLFHEINVTFLLVKQDLVRYINSGIDTIPLILIDDNIGSMMALVSGGEPYGLCSDCGATGKDLGNKETGGSCPRCSGRGWFPMKDREHHKG